MNKYNSEPIVVGQFPLVSQGEFMIYQYLPIRLYNSYELAIPERLFEFGDFVKRCLDDYGWGKLYDKYIYLTVKRMVVSPQYFGNRGGWHCDGFGTNDINYICHDKNPTEFCIQDFTLSNDCYKSMLEMESQARKENIKTYNNGDILKLNRFNVHRCSTPQKTEVSTFLKLSISDDRYNLIGNSHNYLLNYNWDMVHRGEERNHTSK